MKEKWTNKEEYKMKRKEENLRSIKEREGETKGIQEREKTEIMKERNR
jgi:hypothetical protein